MEAARTPSSKSNVFINHRGEDTKKSLASLLYYPLRNYGLSVFLDKKELPTGNPFPPEIEAAISSSSVYITIFSPQYAGSTWCLRELGLMLQQRDQRTIIPIFFDVEPSDLKYLNQGPYKDAFTKHEVRGREDVDTWKEALNTAAGITGHKFASENDDWGDLVDKIVDLVLKNVRRQHFCVAEHPVGLDKPTKNLNKVILEALKKSADSTVLGIAGLSGSGKTALATYLYNEKCKEFSRSSFCVLRGSDVTSLQKQLLTELLGDCKSTVENNMIGEILLRRLRTLSPSKVFIVLDNIDDVDQIKYLLLPVKNVLPGGSLIVITSSDKSFLASIEVKWHNMKLLDEEDAEELLCHYAFHTSEPQRGFADLVKKLVKICGGYPFAMEVLGPRLYKKGQGTWKVILEDCKKNKFPQEIVEKIRAPYKSLKEEDVKAAFLHVATFFDEQEDVQLVVRDNPEEACALLDWIKTLGQKCLVECQRVEVSDQGRIKYDDDKHDFCIKHWIGVQRPYVGSESVSTYNDWKIGMHNFVKDIAKQIASEDRGLPESCTENQMISLDSKISDRVQELPKRTTAQESLRHVIVVDDCIHKFGQLNFLTRFLRRLRQPIASSTSPSRCLNGREGDAELEYPLPPRADSSGDINFQGCPESSLYNLQKRDVPDSSGDVNSQGSMEAPSGKRQKIDV